MSQESSQTGPKMPVDGFLAKTFPDPFVVPPTNVTDAIKKKCDLPYTTQFLFCQNA